VQPFITVVQIWKSDTETIPIPVLGVFASNETACDNAVAIVIRHLTAHAPELLAATVTAVATPLPDATVREFLTTLNNTRPDLLRTPRGKGR